MPRQSRGKQMMEVSRAANRSLLAVAFALVIYLAVVPAQAAFLQGSLPLQPILATPSDLLSNDAKEINVKERVPFTVVFSRPVIALGSDFGQAKLPQSLVPFTVSCPVPGRYRWVTTTIFRFDPSIDWPTDLNCQFKWNKEMKAYDGAPLVLGDAPQAVKITSPPVTMEISDVSSKKAQELTDGQWNAYRGMKDDNFPEVPPDANVTLSFSYPVVLSSLQSALKIASCCKRSAGDGRTLKVLPCSPPWVIPDPFSARPKDPMAQNSTCAVVRVEPGLRAGEVVSLRLPAGAVYNPAAGAATEAREVFLWGLRRFRIPLRDNFQQLKDAQDDLDNDDNGISYRRMSVWLPHGLAPDVKMVRLADQLSLCLYQDPYKWSSPCDPVKLYLEKVDRGKLLVRVPSFVPRQHYRLRVKADKEIKDGFGLPLEASEAFFFTTEPTPDMSGPELSDDSTVVVLEPSEGEEPLEWPVASRGAPRYDEDSVGASMWPLSVGSYPEAVKLTYGGNGPPTKLGKSRSALKRYDGPLPKISSLLLSGFPGLQLVAQTKKSGGIVRATYVAQTALQYASTVLGTKMMIWITDTRGTPPPAVKGATVTLFFASYGEAAKKGPRCTTGADGTCLIDLKPLLKGFSGSLSAIVEAEGHGPLLVSSIDSPYVPTDDSSGTPLRYSGTVALDRALVKPGEKLHITGYLQQLDGMRPSLPPASLTSALLTVSPNFSPSGDAMNFTVNVDPAFGSFHYVIEVPASAQLLNYELGVQVPSSNQKSEPGSNPPSVATASFTVADPRPPTAVLNVTTPDWALPSSTVKVLIKASSYLGADVSDALVSITWTVPKASGAANITTDAKGRAVLLVPLGSLPAVNATQLGDTLDIKAQWVGPTGEPIFKSKTVRIAEGPVGAVLSRSPATDVPGVPFIVSASAFLNDEGQTPLEGVTVEVTLAPANGSYSLQNCSSDAKASLGAQKCRVESGAAPVGPDGKACQLSIPCAADLVIKACAVAFANGTEIRGGVGGGAPPCSTSPIGRNTSAWEASPWGFQPALVLLQDRDNYTLGSKAVISFSAPSYSGSTSAVVVWGNSEAQKSRVIPKLAAGPNRIDVGPLGDECRSGCKVAVVVAAGRPTDAAKAMRGVPAAVPVSKLFDPLAPYTLSGSLDLRILGEDRLSVSVGVEGDGGARTRNGGVAVAAPFGGATVTVEVKDADTGAPAEGAEVTVVVVDQAILDLMPYDVPDLAENIQPPMTDLYLDITDINGCRASRKAINATFSTLARRIGIDPWIPLSTTVTPSKVFNLGSWGSPAYYPAANPVDIPDKTYISQYSSAVTVTPFYTWGLTQRYPAGSKGGADDSAALRLGDEFQTTPVFKTITTGASGTATLEIKGPANLGRFSVRAFVVNKGVAGKTSKYGANSTDMVVRLPVSLTPALPRIVRVGDVFEAGVLVTAPDTAEPLEVTVVATVTPSSAAMAAAGAAPSDSAPEAAPGRRLLQDAAAAPDGAAGNVTIRLAAGGPNERTAALGVARQQTEVRFRFDALEVGESGLRFDAFVGGKAADSASFDVPVIGRQGEVFVATSFALQAGNGSAGAAQTEGLDLPEADLGSGSVDLTAGVGNLPFLQTTLESLVAEQQRSSLKNTYAPSSVAAAVLPALIGRYQAAGPAAAGKAAAASLVTAKQAAASEAAAGEVVEKLTDQTLGLLYSDPGESSWGYRPDRTYISLNGWAVWMVESAAGLQGDAKSAKGSQQALKALKPLEGAAATWRKAVERQIIEDAKKARERGPYYDPYGTQPRTAAGAAPKPRYDDFSDLSWARLALGADWSPVVGNGTDSGVADDLSMSRLVAAAKAPGNVTVGTAARAGLALLARPGGAPAGSAAARDASAIARVLQSQIRVQGRTAYIAATPTSASAAFAEDQAFALAFLSKVASKSGPRASLIQKLSAGVAAGPNLSGLGPLCFSVFGQSGGTSAVALTVYDDSRGSTAPDVVVTASALPRNATSDKGGKVLLRAEFNAKGAGRAAASSTPWGALPPGAGELSFSVAGRGEVSVAAGLRFTPAQLLPFPTYRGLWVERVVQDEAGSGNLIAAALSQIVTVTVQVTTPDDLGQVVVEVQMPGGLEPIDPSVYKDPRAALSCDLGEGGGSGGFWRYIWCPRPEVSPRVVTIRYNGLPAGTATVSFKATAATMGTFALPPVKAYAVQQPEVMGLSAAGSFVVCPEAPRASRVTKLVRDPGFGADNTNEAGAASPASDAGADTSKVGPFPEVCGSAAGASRPPVAPAKACPADCSGNGVCDLASGACLCNRGFAGADCSKSAATR